MTYPTVHLNGTGAEDLLRQYQDAYHAVERALEVVARSCPHGRDYYVQADPQAAAWIERGSR